jgi:transcriptional regulator GlxA family with amidase domain
MKKLTILFAIFIGQVAHAQFELPRKEIKTVGILLYDGYTNLDAMGPHQVLSELMGTKVFFVAKKAGLVRNASGVKVQVERTFADTPQLDILVIPGGLAETYQLTKDTATLAWISQIDQKSIYTTSVCTGAWVLGATGVLKDKKATTHWYGKQILAEEFGANVQHERYTHDGKYWTSAGVTAGMDMCLALVREIRGEAYTKAAMLDLEYDPLPPLKGGTDTNTEKPIVDMMRQMYDNGMKAVQKKE